jgi:hypothetical protein
MMIFHLLYEKNPLKTYFSILLIGNMKKANKSKEVSAWILVPF